METFIEIKNITKSYKRKKEVLIALDDVSLTIFKGEILSLLGVNGAGKTTLSSILATVHPPTSGDVLYLGKSIYKHLAEYRMALGFCPQVPTLDMQLSVEQNLYFAGTFYVIPHDTLRQRIDYLMGHYGLTRYRNFPIHALSGGYKQRLSLARALLHEPQFLILDEPTVGLDPGIRRQLWEHIRELQGQGMTILLTTHYLEEAESLSHRVCILHKGKLVIVESVAKLQEMYENRSLENIFLKLTYEETNGHHHP